MSKNKIDSTEKILTVQNILQGKESTCHAAERLNVNEASIRRWIMKYRSEGADAFFFHKNNCYSAEFKMQAVLDYLDGNGSLMDICQKYKIRSTRQLRVWIKKYNCHEELKQSGTGGSIIMTKGRKTTLSERIEIVQYCIENDHNYAKTSEKFQISYQQARNYTIKFETGGIDALQDRRGKHKSIDEMSELERLRAENKLLRAQKMRAEMEVSFLKKLEEIERRRD